MVGIIIIYNFFVICIVNNVCDYILWIRLEGRVISINKYILLVIFYIFFFNFNSRCIKDLNKFFEILIIFNNIECGINFNLVLGELYG